MGTEVIAKDIVIVEETQHCKAGLIVDTEVYVFMFLPNAVRLAVHLHQPIGYLDVRSTVYARLKHRHHQILNQCFLGEEEVGCHYLLLLGRLPIGCTAVCAWFILRALGV